MSYKPPYTITPKITNLVAQISEAIGSYYAHENLRLHRVNRIKTIHGTLAIEGNTSPAGRVFGKMGHSERSGEYLYKNVTGDKYQPIFEGGVDYFKV